MKTNFEDYVESIIPEINMLSISNTKIIPGAMLESMEKDIYVGHIKNYLSQSPSLQGFDWTTETYDASILFKNFNVVENTEGALKVMKFLGIDLKLDRDFKFDFDIQEVKGIRFKDFSKIKCEIALEEYKDRNKDTWKKLVGYFLVFETLYATKFALKIEVDKSTGGSLDADWKDKIDVSANLKIDKSSDGVIINNNAEVPFGAIGFKIKRGGLKEVDK